MVGQHIIAAGLLSASLFTIGRFLFTRADELQDWMRPYIVRHPLRKTLESTGYRIVLQATGVLLIVLAFVVLLLLVTGRFQPPSVSLRPAPVNSRLAILASEFEPMQRRTSPQRGHATPAPPLGPVTRTRLARSDHPRPTSGHEREPGAAPRSAGPGTRESGALHRAR